MAKIAVEPQSCLECTDGSDIHRPAFRILSQGAEWAVSDVLCNSGPRDRPFEERHSGAAIAVVIAGTFQYHSSAGRELMIPGSLLLGNAGQHFECRHEHGTGDRCVSFSYTPDFFERLAADAGADGSGRRFKNLRLPPLRVLSPLIAQILALVSHPTVLPSEELSIQLAAQTVRHENGLSTCSTGIRTGNVSRVTRIVRMIEQFPDASHSLAELAREAGLSPYHFLRTFQSLAGTTPHQYSLRIRLRRAAVRLRTERSRILDLALDCGFGDVSNFNRAFRAEFGVSPRVYRRC